MCRPLTLLLLLLTLSCREPVVNPQAPLSLDATAQPTSPAGTLSSLTGETMSDEKPNTGVARCDLPEDVPALRVHLFHDAAQSARSRWMAPIGSADAPALAWHPFTLHTPTGQALSARTCADGRGAIPGLAPGVYLIEPALSAQQRVTNGAFSARFAAALARGQARVVSFGDSMPAYGPQPWFPARLKALAAPLVRVEDVNVARPGSRSDEWLPGGDNYQRRLRPALQGADLIVFSLGGNDLFDILASSARGRDVSAILAAFEAKIAHVKANLRAIITQVRHDQPQAEIIWMLYPNFSKSARWEASLGSARGVVQLLLAGALSSLRQELGAIQGLTLLDMFGATAQEELNLLLVDGLHFSAAGHARAARELFATLGGAIVDDEGAGEAVYTMGISAR